MTSTNLQDHLRKDMLPLSHITNLETKAWGQFMTCQGPFDPKGLFLT